MRIPFRFISTAAAGLMAAALTAAPAGAQSAAVRTPGGGVTTGQVAPPAPTTPSEALQSQPYVRVIVTLADPRRNGNPSSANNRAAIAGLQTAVLDSAFEDPQALASEPRYALHRAKTVPAFAVTVDEAELQRLQADPRVMHIALNRKLRAHLDQSTRQIGMKLAWRKPARARGGGQAVAVLDTGVNLRHPFLDRNRIIAQACFSGLTNPDLSLCPNGEPIQRGGRSGRNCPMDYDDGCDHGTHVAGIAAGFNADYSPGEPRRGVAYKAKIIAVQVFEKDPDEDDPDPEVGASSESILFALDWLYKRRNKFEAPLAAINMSLGGLAPEQGDCDGDTPAVTQVIEKLRAAGIATVVSSGNEGYVDAMVWPACISAVVAVGATTKETEAESERIASYSNTGRFLDILAPGGDYRYPLETDFPREILSSVPGKAYEAFEGTSMAAPHIAGVFAAVRSVENCEDKSVGKIVKAMRRTGKKIPDVVYRNKKRVEVTRSLSYLGCAGFGL